jgi:hypothetical protein
VNLVSRASTAEMAARPQVAEAGLDPAIVDEVIEAARRSA